MKSSIKKRILSLVLAMMLVLTTIITPNGFFGVKDADAAGHDIETYNVNADPSGPNAFIWDNESTFFNDSWAVGTVFEGKASVIDSRTTTNIQITEKNFFVTHKGAAYGEFNYATVKCTSGKFSGIILKENNCMNPGWDTPFVGMESSSDGWYSFGTSDAYSFGYRATLVSKSGSVASGDVKFKWKFEFSWTCPQNTATNMTNGVTLPSGLTTYADGIKGYPGNKTFSTLSHKYGNVCWLKDATNNRWIPLSVQAVSEYLEYGFRDDLEGNLKLTKNSSTPAITALNSSAYALSGATYGIYKSMSNTSPVKTVTIGSDNTATATNLPKGTYYIKEISAPSGYTLDNTWHGPYTVNANDTTNVTVSETPKTGSVTIVKNRDNTDFTGSKYNLAGAEYTLYYNADSSNVLSGSKGQYTLSTNTRKIGVFTIDTNGVGQVSSISQTGVTGTNTTKMDKLPFGNYALVETKLPTAGGYDWDKSNHTFTITASSTSYAVNVEATDPCRNDPIFIELEKIDDEGNVIAHDDLTMPLTGAVFEVKYYNEVYASKSNLPANATRTWYVQTVEVDGKYKADLSNTSSFLSSVTIGSKTYTSDERYIDTDSQMPCVPIGTITVREIKAADGYILESGTVKSGSTTFDDRVAFGTITSNDSADGGAVLSFGATNKLQVSNGPERGNLSFNKKDTGNVELANVLFSLTLLKSDGTAFETHNITTDDKGAFNSADSDVWFYGTSDKTKWDTSKIKAGVGRLIQGTYILKELPCDANVGLQLIDPITFTVTDNGQVVNQGTIIDVENPTIKTLEWDKDNSGDEGKTHISMADNEVTVIDTVTYKNLRAGEKYTVKGILVNTSGTPIKDKDGNYVVAYKTFTAKASDNPQQSTGTVDVTFTFNAQNLAGTKFVIFEYLYTGTDETNVTVTEDVIDESGVAKDKDGVPIKHTDTTDDEQIGFFPQVSTTAKNKETGEQQVPAGVTAVVRDTVKYTNLIAGESFTVSGQIMDASTGKAPVVNGKTKTITASKTFSPEETSGSVWLDYSFDTTGMEGMTLVVYETVKYNKYGQTVVEHHNRNDKKQQIYIPELGTQASDNVTGNNVSYANGQVVINDVVSYKNLVPGKTYTVNGKLVEQLKDAEGKLVEGEVIKDKEGKEVTASESFVASATGNGTVTVVFKFDASDDLAGKTAVAFEEIPGYGSHADITDKPQTIQFPKIGTTAKNAELIPLSETDDDTKVAQAKKGIKLVDTIAYENLNVDYTYKIYGTLMNKETGEPVLDDNGKEVTGYIGTPGNNTFNPTTSDGTVDMIFEFDGENLIDKETGNGTITVAFETLKVVKEDESEEVVADHSKIDSREQTVVFPGGHTTALGEQTNDKHIKADEKQTIVDYVYYDHLLPNTTYTLDGTVMLKPLETNYLAGTLSFKPIEEETEETQEDTESEAEPVEESGSELGDEGDDEETLEAKSFDVSDTDGAELTEELQKYLDAEGLEATFTDKNGNEYSLTEVGIELGENAIFVVPMYGDKPVSGTFNAKSAPVIHSEDEEVEEGDQPEEWALAIEVSADGTKISDEDAARLKEVYDWSIVTSDGKVYSTDNGAFSISEDNILTVYGTDTDPTKVAPLVADGKVVKNSVEFTTGDAPEGEQFVSGTAVITFTFNASALEGRSVVAFETVKQNGVTVFVHADIDDENQTVHVPKIRTKAKDKSTDDSIALGDTIIPLIDTVTYTNLVPGKSYVLKGVLMDKTTGKPFIDADGKEVYGEKPFVAPEAKEGEKTVSGSEEVEFTFNAKGLKGIETVVFEDLYLDNIDIATHADITDKGQTTTIPGGKTKASDGKTGTHTGKPEKTAKIIDIVSYTKLLPEKDYVVKGTLMDKSTGEPLIVDGKEVTVEKPFKTEAAAEGEFTVDGEVEMVFEFDASALEGKTVVVFENVSYNGMDVFVHADLEDEEQTIRYPKISTLADIDNGKKKAEEAKNLVIRDVVSYEGLTPGEKYIIKGVLMNPSTGSFFIAGGKQIEVQAEFIPEQENGKVEVAFTFDGTDLIEPGKSMKVVVFETLYTEKGEEVASHKEIDDEKQTVEIYKPKKPPKTGDDFNMILIIIGATVAFILATALKRRKDS